MYTGSWYMCYKPHAHLASICWVHAGSRWWNAVCILRIGRSHLEKLVALEAVYERPPSFPVRRTCAIHGARLNRVHKAFTRPVLINGCAAAALFIGPARDRTIPAVRLPARTAIGTAIPFVDVGGCSVVVYLEALPGVRTRAGVLRTFRIRVKCISKRKESTRKSRQM